MPDYTKGGRGKVAPYKTIHARIPEDIKPIVEELSNAYKEQFSILDSSINEKYVNEILEAIKPIISKTKKKKPT